MKTTSERVVAEMYRFFDQKTLTRVAFAKEVGVSRMQLHNIMTGVHPPRGARLRKIVWVLDKYGHDLPEDL